MAFDVGQLVANVRLVGLSEVVNHFACAKRLKMFVGVERFEYVGIDDGQEEVDVDAASAANLGGGFVAHAK